MQSKNAHVLIVDDDPDTLSLLSLTLRSSGYEVTKAISGASAIAFIENNDYDLIILDLMMPEISGFDVLRALRVRKREMPAVILLTAKDTLEDQLTARQLGVVDYVTKPVARDVLLKKIQAAIT
ncbi:MAG: response regulator [Chloroflexota bacterium]